MVQLVSDILIEEAQRSDHEHRATLVTGMYLRCHKLP